MSLAPAFLAALARPGPVDARGIALVVAHPDDEAIGLGGQLPRLPGITVVHLTDGAPRDGRDAAAHGYAGSAAYAAARARELAAALDLAGVSSEGRITLGLPDQGAARDLPGLARRLAALFAERGIRLVLTHPWEGGHPDHDASAVAVAAAARLLAREGRPAPGIVEMAFYHASDVGLVTQRFLPNPESRETVLAVEGAALATKRAMLAAHATQAGTLALFPEATERLRPAPPYDFAAPPNGGRLHYEALGWGMTAAAWRAALPAALADLGLDR